MLSSLEDGSFAPKVRKAAEDIDDGMISFEDFSEKEVCDKLRECDINTLTPLEAMSFIFDLKKLLM